MGEWITAGVYMVREILEVKDSPNASLFGAENS
jgi:hypothetical protein